MATTWRDGTVTAVTGGWGGPAGSVVLTVALSAPHDGQVRALAYPAVVGDPRPGTGCC